MNLLNRLKLMLPFLLVSLIASSQNKSNPYSNYEFNLSSAKHEITSITEEYNKTFNEFKELLAKYNETQAKIKTLKEETEVEPKGEFEKESDYQLRVGEHEGEIQELIYRQSNTYKDYSSKCNVLLNLYNEYFGWVYNREFYAPLAEHIQVPDKMSAIQAYNSESEFFIVTFKSKSCKIKVSIKLAKDFKEKYDQLTVYNFVNEFWVSYGDSRWSQIENTSFVNEKRFRVNAQERLNFLQIKKEEIAQIIKEDDYKNAVFFSEELVVPYPSVFLDLSLLDD